MKNLFLTLSLILVFAGCSTKEFNEGVDSITGDVSRLFEDGKDKSSR